MEKVYEKPGGRGLYLGLIIPRSWAYLAERRDGAEAWFDRREQAIRWLRQQLPAVSA